MRTAIFALFVAGLAGCMTYRPRDVIVRVRDAETHNPVPGAVVRVSMPHAGDDGKIETTLPNGMARVVFTPSPGEPVMIEATAAGYISDSTVTNEPSVAAVQSHPIVGPALPHSPDFTLELFAGPKFAIEFVLPAAYRGLVRADLDFRDDIAIPKGQRLYTFTASPNGEISGTGPAVLKKVSPREYRARTVDMQTSADDGPDGLALRWLKRQDGKELFHFGTKAEFEQYRKDSGGEASTSSQPSDLPKKGGRDGGHRRGGM